MATVLATLFEGSGLLRNVQFIYDFGFRFAVVLLLVPCGMWIISRLSLCMGPFIQHLSIAETMGSIYGKYTMLITGLDSALNCIIMVTTQITIMSEAIRMCVPLANPYVISIFCTLFILFILLLEVFVPLPLQIYCNL